MAEPAAPKTPRDHFISLVRNQILALSDADLDFGVYRILRHRREAIERFLTEDLPARLDAVTKREGARALAALESEIQEARQKVEEAAKVLEVDVPYEADGSLNPELAGSKPGKAYAEKVQELERLKAQGGFSRDEEADLYHHLFTFFSRYYRDGDFQPQPRRSRRARYVVPQPQSHGENQDAAQEEGTEAVAVSPYNGQDVHLHWRSRGMHYAKTTEHFRVYRATDAASKQRLRFEIVSAEADRDNAKAGEDRFFVPLHKQARTEEGAIFVLPFEYRALTAAEKTRLGKKKKEAQEALIAEAADALKLPPGLSKEAFENHARKYARRNQRDYFIHPALGAFLREELDHYLKAEYLDLTATPDAAALADRLAKLQALREVGGALIELLDGIETFQARLFEKRRFVFASDYLVPVHLVPEALHAQVIAEPKQVQAWRRDLALEGEVTAETLKERPTLVVDTRYFRQDDGTNPLRDAILAEIEDIEAVTDGLLVYGENYGALRTLTPLLKESVKCTYIDPPYNTGGDDFLYKDDFARHSTWLTMMEERLALGKQLMTRDGVLFLSIDDNEQSLAVELTRQTFGESNFLTSMVWEGGLKNDSRYLSVSHDYIITVLKDAEHLAESGARWRTRKEGVDDIYKQAKKLVKQSESDYGKASAALRAWYRGLPKGHPAALHAHYKWIDKRGVYFGGDISWPGPGGPRYEVLHPITGKPVTVPKSGWRLSKPETMEAAIADDRVHFGPDEAAVPTYKRYLHETEGQVVPSVIYKDRRYAYQLLREITGREDFANPKDPEVISKLAEMLGDSGMTVLDYFGGSGTTAHAIIALNRADGGRRHFVLADMGDHFWSVLLPRITKLMYAPNWKAGNPSIETAFSEMPEWAERGPRLVQILSLESYDDSLDALTEQAGEDGGLFDAARLEYLLPDATGDFGQADVLLNRERPETPFSYALRIHTPEGERPRLVDLVETTNFALGLRVKRRLSITVEDRHYVVIEAKDGDGRSALVLWRTVDETFDPAQDAAALEALGVDIAAFDRVLVNADAALPGAESLDPLLLSALVSRDPLAARGTAA